ncbi:MAG: hypothetical protein Tsb0020_37170 [Haliangiales bacterium]
MSERVAWTDRAGTGAGLRFIAHAERFTAGGSGRCELVIWTTRTDPIASFRDIADAGCDPTDVACRLESHCDALRFSAAAVNLSSLACIARVARRTGDTTHDAVGIQTGATPDASINIAFHTRSQKCIGWAFAAFTIAKLGDIAGAACGAAFSARLARRDRHTHLFPIDALGLSDFAEAAGIARLARDTVRSWRRSIAEGWRCSIDSARLARSHTVDGTTISH